MVSSNSDGSTLTIIVRPNRSASWRANKLLLLALAVPSLGSAIGFALVGAWPILPFAGLELGAVGSCLYYVNWKLQYRHVITLEPDRIRIDKGFYLPRQSWSFARGNTRLAIVPKRHPWDSPLLSLCNSGESISIGEFLNREDALILQGLLQRQLRISEDQGRGSLAC